MENSTLLLNENKIGSDLIIKTPNSQQNNSDVRRWASVVKAHKTILNSPEVKRFVSEDDEAIESFDLAHNVSVNYENQKGFITLNKNSFFCQICSFDLDTMISLTNHLKTRKHEDNVIVFLKNKLPAHLEHMMEFVSFCKSDLCCNLCQETIEMSLNPHETLLNIVAHNTGVTHASQRENHDGHNLAHNLLNVISVTHPEIMKNLHFVDKKIIPQFKCKLCNANIVYNENVDVLEKRFISHFKSLDHVKNQKAVEVLKLFDEVSNPGKEKFVVMNGNILCTVCNGQVDTNVEKLIMHVKGVEHASRSLAELKLCSALDVQNENECGEENEISGITQVLFNQKTIELETINKEQVENDEKVNPDVKLNRLMSTLPSDLRQIDYLSENEKGSVLCLICNCVVPPCKHNILIHINGINHQRKMEPKQVSKLKEPKNLNKNQAENKKPLQTPFLKMLLKSLPEKLGDINYVVTNIKGDTECLVCQCYLPLVTSEIEDHLRSLNHKKMENQWMTNCPGCPWSRRSDKFIEEIQKIPKELRVYRCKSVNTILPTSILDNYNLLVKKHSLIAIHKDALVINVDGKNCYCKPCKGLISLSSDISDLEKNLVSHLIGKTHMLNYIKNFGKKLEEVPKTPQSSSGKVVRSLFLFSSGDEQKIADTKLQVGESSSSFDKQKFNICTTPSLQKKITRVSESHERSKENNDSKVFIFGKNNNEQSNLENLKNKNTASKITKEHKALPVSKTNRSPTFELEADEAVLSRRQKQLDYGKNTEGYTRYRKAVPLTKRRLCHPATPPKHVKCSRRTWDGMVRSWRKKLHAWDLPQESTSLEQDIQTLPLQVC